MKSSVRVLRIRNVPLKIKKKKKVVFHGTVASLKNETIGRDLQMVVHSKITLDKERSILRM